MILSDTTEIQSVFRPNRAAEIGDKFPSKAATKAQKESTEENPAFRVDARPGPEGLVDIDAVNEKRNAMARTIHQVDTTMENIDGQMEQMKERLLRIVKHYPPYPPDSQERSDYLKSFTTMRRLIDRLTFPKNQDDGALAMNTPPPAPDDSPRVDEAIPENGVMSHDFGRRL